MFHVDSEVGRLRQVVLHRPDLELKRLTPDNAADLLFDDVLWVSRAQAEHDAFAGALTSRGVVVHYYSDLLAQTLEIADAREYILDRVFDPRWHGPLAASTLRAAMAGLGPAELASFLAGGITKREIAELGPEPKSIAFHSLDPDGFVLAPLPNLLYQRDNSCWIYGGVSINAMRKPARIRETVTGEAIYRWHPMFAGAEFEVWYHGADAAPATIEGGPLPGGDRHAQDACVHAPGHAADDGGLRGVHQVRRDGDAAVVHGRARRERAGAQGHRSPAGGHAHRHRRRARAALDHRADRRPGRPLRAAGTV